VPLDYDNPRGPTTTIALARTPATDQANKVGTVFVNPGGPGGSGVSLILGGFGETLDTLLGGRFDIIGFDPRGVAASDPLQCFDTEGDRSAHFTGAPAFPYLDEQMRPFFDVYTRFTSQCLSRQPRVLRHMSTADVVRDLDLLRRAVGDERLTYLGFSYGSFIGNTYANMFPNKVRALAIDGVLDPRLWSSGAQIVSDRVATAQEFDEFLRLCDEAGDACLLSGPEGAAARYDALVKAVRETPLVLDGFLYSYDFLVADSVSAMYAPEFWPFFAELFDLLADTAAGNPPAAQQAFAKREAIQEILRQAAPARETYNNSFEAYFGNHCADAGYPRTLPGFKAVDAFAAAGSIYGPYWWWFNAACANWPVSPDRYVGPWTARTSAPVLVVGNFFDGVTDYAGAVASSKLLKNSRLLSYAGWGHTAFGRSSCATDHIIAYLRDGTLPPAGTVCPANFNPFLSPATSRAQGMRVPMIGLPPAYPAR
jgi:pimeloyl-ACP methyl ester carboxylesterase